MAKNLLDIEDIPPQLANKVKQNLKFKTGKFIWRIRFNIPLDPKSVNNEGMYVTNSQNQRLQTHITYDTKNELIEIEPLEPYSTNEMYTLNITTKVKSRGGQTLKQPVSVKFKL